MAHLRNLEVLGSGLLEDRLVGEAGKSGSDVLSLAHLEVLAEVLVTAPPVQVDHAQSLVSSNLMEVRVSDIVLDTIGRESMLTVSETVHSVGLTNTVTPVLDHALLLVFDQNIEEETAPKMEDDQAPEETNAVRFVEWLRLPVHVGKGILEEASDVLERSESLGLITRFLSLVHKLAEITISVLCESSIKQIPVEIDVGILTFRSYRHAH